MGLRRVGKKKGCKRDVEGRKREREREINRERERNNEKGDGKLVRAIKY